MRRYKEQGNGYFIEYTEYDAGSNLFGEDDTITAYAELTLKCGKTLSFELYYTHGIIDAYLRYDEDHVSFFVGDIDTSNEQDMDRLVGSIYEFMVDLYTSDFDRFYDLLNDFIQHCEEKLGN